MLQNIPKIIVPVSTFTGVDSTLSGVITISGKKITGVNTKFIEEITIGAELFVNNTMIGMISRIDSDTECYLEEEASNYTGSAKIRNFNMSDTAKPITMSDILVRIHPAAKYAEKSAILMPYTIVEGDTPDIVSYKFYGTPLYHWIILLVNNITNPREEWPLTEKQLVEKIKLNYPGQSGNNTYEWREKTNDYVVDYNPVLAGLEEIYPVSIYQYETEKNEKKRNIRVLDPVFIVDFVTAYNRADIR